MTEKYITFLGEDVAGLADLGISRVMVEVSSAGSVVREIGFDSSDKVVYRFPGHGRFGARGLFDNSTISALQLTSDLSLEEFNAFFGEKE